MTGEAEVEAEESEATGGFQQALEEEAAQFEQAQDPQDPQPGPSGDEAPPLPSLFFDEEESAVAAPQRIKLEPKYNLEN